MHDARQKRPRRTKEQMDELLAAVQGVLDNYDGDRISVRHLCYRLASVGVIAKTERDFKTLGDDLGNWRKKGEIPFGSFVDSSRWYFGGNTFDDAAEALEDAISVYRKNLWRTQPYFAEVWVEKEAIASSSCRSLTAGASARSPVVDSLRSLRPGKQLSSLNSILSAMRLQRRQQLRRRRERRHP